MRNLSFFKRRLLSGYIRAGQIAERIGAKLNPESGYDDDVCIFIKWTPNISKWGELCLDVVDRHQCLDWLARHPDCTAIAISLTAVEYMSERLKNKIVLIPQQHSNYDRIRRVDRPVKVVGYCGEYHTFAPFETEIRERLAKIGMELKFYHQYKNVTDVVEFYKTIDVQIIWRVEPGYIKMLKNPLKLSNAGSFGIPTVAQPEENFVREYDGCFLPVNTIDELIGNVEDLKNDSKLYLDMANKAIEKSEAYHIDNIGNLYRKLGASSV